jgi:hypothetical protein
MVRQPRNVLGKEIASCLSRRRAQSRAERPLLAIPAPVMPGRDLLLRKIQRLEEASTNLKPAAIVTLINVEALKDLRRD